MGFAYIAAVSGAFDISNGLSPKEEADVTGTDETSPSYVSRLGESYANPVVAQQSPLIISAVYAVIKLVLAVRYIRMAYYAKRANFSTRSILTSLRGLLATVTCFWIAFGLSYTVDRPHAIARIVMWSMGLAIEFASMYLSSLDSRALRIETSYFCERFAAFTLIVIGEGLISVFERLSSVISGSTAGYSNSIIGAVIAVVGLYQVLYSKSPWHCLHLAGSSLSDTATGLYFGQHTHHLRGGPSTHAICGLLHWPLHLAILLLSQCQYSLVVQFP